MNRIGLQPSERNVEAHSERHDADEADEHEKAQIVSADGHAEQFGRHLQRGRVQQDRVQVLGRGVPVYERADADQVATGLRLTAGHAASGVMRDHVAFETVSIMAPFDRDLYSRDSVFEAYLEERDQRDDQPEQHVGEAGGEYVNRAGRHIAEQMRHARDGVAQVQHGQAGDRQRDPRVQMVQQLAELADLLLRNRSNRGATALKWLFSAGSENRKPTLIQLSGSMVAAQHVAHQAVAHDHHHLHEIVKEQRDGEHHFQQVARAGPSRQCARPSERAEPFECAGPVGTEEDDVGRGGCQPDKPEPKVQPKRQHEAARSEWNEGPTTYSFDETLQLFVIGKPIDEDRQKVPVQVEQGRYEVDEDGFPGGEQPVVTRVAVQGRGRPPTGQPLVY
uniref:Uncharacterized protein n=1 Tax=Anopheles atroparvus TaxID=41427 RepID=A0A182J727_ANOAO